MEKLLEPETRGINHMQTQMTATVVFSPQYSTDTDKPTAETKW